MTSETVCSSCRKVKHQLNVRKSRLLPDIGLYLCDTCVKERLEPRWIIIMVGRDPDQGLAAIKDYVGKTPRYLGDPIMVSELV